MIHSQKIFENFMTTHQDLYDYLTRNGLRHVTPGGFEFCFLCPGQKPHWALLYRPSDRRAHQVGVKKSRPTFVQEFFDGIEPFLEFVKVETTNAHFDLYRVTEWGPFVDFVKKYESPRGLCQSLTHMQEEFLPSSTLAEGSPLHTPFRSTPNSTLGTSMKLNPNLSSILAPAYVPCVEFQRACTEMRWKPGQGHVPRGFCGATGALEDVELVLVFAEPGDPQEAECHTGLESAYIYATSGFATGKDIFYQNVRKILGMCWPNLAFEQQMQKVWLTESVLCSAKKEGGSVSAAASRACGKRYLLAQLSLFPKALVVALGTKAQKRLGDLGGINFISATAVAPPGCNRREAMPSWELISRELQRRRGEDS